MAKDLARERGLEPTEQVVTAIWEVTADSGIEALYVNGVRIASENRALTGRAARYNIAAQLRPGQNLLGIRAYHRPQNNLAAAGLAFRLILEVTAPHGKKSPRQPSYGAVVEVKNGDLMSGDYININPAGEFAL